MKLSTITLLTVGIIFTQTQAVKAQNTDGFCPALTADEASHILRTKPSSITKDNVKWNLSVPHLKECTAQDCLPQDVTVGGTSALPGADGKCDAKITLSNGQVAHIQYWR